MTAIKSDVSVNAATMPKLAVPMMLLGLLGLGIAHADPNAPDQKESSNEKTSWETNKRNEAALDFLRSSFKRELTGGRVYYSASTCEAGSALIPFPELKVKKSATTKFGLPAVQEVFADDPRVEVREGADGIIDIVIGDVPKEFLQTRIHRIDLDSEARFNAILAVDAIMATKPVAAAQKKLNLLSPIVFEDTLLSWPLPGLPHLPRTVKNITLDQALDTVAKTFSGIVVFGYCTNTRMYSVDFTGGYNYADDAPIIWDQSRQHVRH
jgi:hypothetical protein